METVTIEDLNKELCELAGIDSISGIQINPKTKEIRKYKLVSSLRRKPKKWDSTLVIRFAEPVYPDFSFPQNFITLLELQWNMFGSLGRQYEQIENESFMYNYLLYKVKAIQQVKSFGGSETLDEYLNILKECKLWYQINVDGKTKMIQF